MAGLPRVYWRNYDSSDNTTYQTRTNMYYQILFTIEECGFSAPAGKVFKEWNDARDGTGTSYQAGETTDTNESVYAIWESADISISYAGSQIATMNSSGTKTLLTEGKYCTDDITIDYTKPTPDPNLQSKSVSPTTSSQTITADSGYDGLSQVTVNAMPSGSARTPATTITANPTISVSASGLITASVSKTQGVTPTVSAGYVVTGTSGTITVNGSNTSQLTVYNGAHHQPTPANYTVTVSLTNPFSPSDFSSCNIYDSPTSDTHEWGTIIGSISTASGSTEVLVDSASYGIIVQPNGRWGNGFTEQDISCTGGATLTSVDCNSYGALFAITGDGTITIDGIDYGD